MVSKAAIASRWHSHLFPALIGSFAHLLTTDEERRTFLRLKACCLIRQSSIRSAERDSFAASEGFTLSRVFVEVETGKGADALDRRPQLAPALSEARRQRCSVAVAKLDRLANIATKLTK